MPDILASSRLIVLAGGYSLTGVGCLHGQSNSPTHFVNFSSKLKWQIVDVLEVLIGNDNNMALIVRPLVRADEGSNCRIPINSIRFNGVNMFVLHALNK